MSRFVDEAHAAYRRWRDTSGATIPPVVRVQLLNGLVRYFNGLAIAPAATGPEVVTLSSLGTNVATIVVRDEHIFVIEIEPVV